MGIHDRLGRRHHEHRQRREPGDADQRHPCLLGAGLVQRARHGDQQRRRVGCGHGGRARRRAQRVGRRRRYRRLYQERGFPHCEPDGHHSGHRDGRGRQRLSGRHERRLQELLQPDLGPVQGPHQAGARQPRLYHDERERLFQLLRLGRWRVRQGLLQLRPRRLARRGAEQQHHDERGLAAGGVAARGSCQEHEALHARLLAPPALQLWQRGRSRRDAAALAGFVQRRRGGRCRRTRPRLRALRPAEPDRRGGLDPRDPRNRGWHRRRRFVRRQSTGAEL